MLTVLEIIKKTTEFLATKGIEQPRLNSELLVGHALGLKRMQLYLQFERPLNEADLEKIRPLVRRRGQREPIQYVLGETEFHGLMLKTDRRALIPRPETEYLIERIVAQLSAAPAAVLDLGTGTGAVALAIAQKFPEARVVGVDRSPDALALATENAARCGLDSRVRWVLSDWYGTLTPELTFDLVVANPPYLTKQEVAEASAEVRQFEPTTALEGGGPDGVEDLRKIVEGAPRFLNPGGLLALETGIAQHAALRDIVNAAGLKSFESVQDLTGRDRYVFAVQP